MATVTQQDYETMLASVGSLYECDSVERFPRIALQGISKLVSSDHATFNYLAPTVPKAKVLGWPDGGRTPSARRALFEQNLGDQPILRHYLATGDGGAYKISDFLSEREYHALPLYQRLYQELRYEDQMAFMLFPPGSEWIAVAVARGRRTFTERDRHLLNLVRPYLARAYRHVERRGHANGLLPKNGSAGAPPRVTSVVLDEQDRPVQFGSRAQVWLHRFFPDANGDGSGLPPAVGRWLRHVRETAFQRDQAARNEVLVQQREEACLRLRVFSGLARGKQRILALGLHSVRKPEPRLTPREIEVLLEVEQGKCNDEVSTALGISSLTVRKHLENIFRKLHVPCRTAAVIQMRRVGASLFLTAIWLQGIVGAMLQDLQELPT